MSVCGRERGPRPLWNPGLFVQSVKCQGVCVTVVGSHSFRLANSEGLPAMTDCARIWNLGEVSHERPLGVSAGLSK